MQAWACTQEVHLLIIFFMLLGTILVYYMWKSKVASRVCLHACKICTWVHMHTPARVCPWCGGGRSALVVANTHMPCVRSRVSLWQ